MRCLIVVDIVSRPPPTFTPGQHVYRQPEEEKYMDGTAQSRTFRILQSVMHSEGKYNGGGGGGGGGKVDMQ